MQLQSFQRPGSKENATLTCYIAKEVQEGEPPRPAILILPGGGYEFCSPREAEPIAIAYLNAGFNAFVLEHYSVSKQAAFPDALCDAMWAMSVIRGQAERWYIDPRQVAVCGFSAGGHLAASLSVFWEQEEYCKRAGVTPALIRPDAVVLSYAVITAKEQYANIGSIKSLLNERYGEPEWMELLSLEKQVTDRTPPCYLWHTADDPIVPVENSLLFAMALSAHQVPFALRVFQSGPHGLSLAVKRTSSKDYEAQAWLMESVEFLRKNLKL